MNLLAKLFITDFGGGFLLSPIKGTYYLDPGSGSFILQLILATILGAVFVLKSYWSKIREALRNFFSRQWGDEDNDTK